MIKKLRNQPYAPKVGARGRKKIILSMYVTGPVFRAGLWVEREKYEKKNQGGGNDYRCILEGRRNGAPPLRLCYNPYNPCLDWWTRPN
jgi:hypothetical protein